MTFYVGAKIYVSCEEKSPPASFILAWINDCCLSGNLLDCSDMEGEDDIEVEVDNHRNEH